MSELGMTKEEIASIINPRAARVWVNRERNDIIYPHSLHEEWREACEKADAILALLAEKAAPPASKYAGMPVVLKATMMDGGERLEAAPSPTLTEEERDYVESRRAFQHGKMTLVGIIDRLSPPSPAPGKEG